MSPIMAQAFWITGARTSDIRATPVPHPGPGEVRVRTLYSGISRGTETRVFDNQIPESEYQRMRAPFQEGEFPAPVKYGYCSVGVVESGPAELCGQTVFCLYPHQTHYVVPVQAVIPTPESVPAARAILAANLETALNGLWDATPRLGDRISVVGAGTIGCLVAWLAAQMPGCTVELIDVNPSRQDIAARLGARFATPATATPEADLVIHASGAPEGLITALELAGFEALVLELSWFGKQSVPLPLGQAFHARRLTLRSSQVGAVAGAQRARWTYRRRMELALSLLRAPVLDCLISGEDPFAELPAVMARLSAESGHALCHRIRY
ncbi:MAG: zinc-binding alcohol dehydrogenase [Gammaproteobacteria bacterium]|nr:zinc-binding alcohol dehydrogenase [Gammaproteobacteria bacterium]MCP5426059.1 zinc-binding alcohol dehydrogenase [Gammaproteobacteria bacterium]